MPESQDNQAEHSRAAAQIDADVGVEHLADVYAEALLGAAKTADCTRAAIEEFDSLMDDVLDRFPKLEAVLSSGLVSPEEKIGVIDRVLGGRASATLLNFLKVVAHHGRLDCLRVIRDRLGELYDQMQGRIRVQVTTAAPVGGALTGKVAEGLRTALGAEPLVEQIVDPELIGGVVIRVGDTVYDGSIANQLNNVRQQMIDRSVHEIQSRRDRFSYPAGN